MSVFKKDKKELFPIVTTDDVAFSALPLSPNVAPDALPIMQALKDAQDNITICSYQFGTKPIFDLLKAALIRGVAVTISLNGYNPLFGGFNISLNFVRNLQEFAKSIGKSQLLKTLWSSDKYPIQHSKITCVDCFDSEGNIKIYQHSRVFVCTTNFASVASAISWSRDDEFFVITGKEFILEVRALDIKIDIAYILKCYVTNAIVKLSNLNQTPIVLSNGVTVNGQVAPNGLYNPFNGLNVSQGNARRQLYNLIRHANTSITIYAEIISDPDIVTELQNVAFNGVNVRILLCNAISLKNPNFNNIIRPMVRNNIQINTFKEFYIHAKSMCVDNKYLFIGSQNMLTDSLDAFAECGIITGNQSVIAEYQGEFEKDWSKSVSIRSRDESIDNDTPYYDVWKYNGKFPYSNIDLNFISPFFYK